MKQTLYVSLLLLTLNLISLNLKADVYTFSNEENRATYHVLTKELRCPKCQNQDIADSNAPIAKDMRAEVYRLLEAGKSSSAIVDFMVERFGDFVSYKPKVTTSTYLLWYGPWLFVVIGFLAIGLIVKSRNSGSARDAQVKDNRTIEGSDNEARHEKVGALLDKYASVPNQVSATTKEKKQ
jgi:cytochrome c-type biogenesis protein CcmH